MPSLSRSRAARVVQRDDALRLLDRGDDDARAVMPVRTAALDPVGREPPQPHRQVSPGWKARS